MGEERARCGWVEAALAVATFCLPLEVTRFLFLEAPREAQHEARKFLIAHRASTPGTSKEACDRGVVVGSGIGEAHQPGLDAVWIEAVGSQTHRGAELPPERVVRGVEKNPLAELDRGIHVAA